MTFIIKNREDYDKLEKYKKTKEKLFEKQLKEKLTDQSFYYDMKQVFEPSIDAQKDNTKKIIESQESTQKAITEGNQNILNALVKSKTIDTNILPTLSNIMNITNKSQFKLNYDDTLKSFIINPNKQLPVKIEGNNMIFENGNKYDMNNKDLSYFLSNSNINVNDIKDHKLIANFCKDVEYDLKKTGDRKSRRYNFIKKLSSKTFGEGIVFLSSDPNELGDRLYLLYQEKIAGNNSKNINQEMVAIYDKLYEYSIISETDHFRVILQLEG